MGIIYGYARVSTNHQTARQQELLLGEVCNKVLTETGSGKNLDDRQVFRTLMDVIQEGDTLVAMRIDRIARSTKDLLHIVEALSLKGASLKILQQNIDTSGATGKLFVTILGALAEWERDLLLERQKEGIIRAKQEGKYKGRVSVIDKDEVNRLWKSGMDAHAIAKQMSVGVASVYRLREK